MDDYDALHRKKFPVFIPEYYVTKIPDYFKGPRRARPPMVNGVAVSSIEYMELDPTYVPDSEFIPEPIYAPLENNITFSFKSTAEIYNAYSNDVNIQFQNPKNMLEMIIIIENYIHLTSRYEQTDDNVKIWNTKLRDFIGVLHITYAAYKKKLEQRLPHLRSHLGSALPMSELLTLFRGA